MSDFALEQELAANIIEMCHVFEPPATIEYDKPLIGPESIFGLDSLDAVEVLVSVQRDYGVRITQEEARDALRSLHVLAEYIRSNRPE